MFQDGTCVISENPRIWFYAMSADGFSLDDKRSEIAGNDIPSTCPTSSRSGAYI